MLGDFNLPNLDIDTRTPVSNAFSCVEFYNIFQDFSLSHIVELATHISGNRLDLILTTTPEMFFNTFTEPGAYPTDHHLIIVCLSNVWVSHKNPRTVFSYKRANWTGLKQYLATANLIDIINQQWHDVSAA